MATTGIVLITALLTLVAAGVAGAQGANIHQGTLQEPNQKTPEVSTGAVQPGKDVREVRKAKDDGRLPMEDRCGQITSSNDDVVPMA